MNSKNARRRRWLLRQLSNLDQQDAGNPPPPPIDPPKHAVATGAPQPQMWRFEHTRPGIVGVIYCVVQTPDIHEARGAAYLLAEQFAENCIGFIKAKLPPNLPKR